MLTLSRKHLQEALVIVKLKEETMVGDYARVLHKLSGLLKKSPGLEVEGAEKAAVASRIRKRMSGISELSMELSGGLGQDDEERYDELVYILWR